MSKLGSAFAPISVLLLVACAGSKPRLSTTAQPSTNINGMIIERCAVRGVVHGAGGAPVAGALIAAVPENGDRPAAVTRSDADGHYCFADLPAGP